MILILPSIVCIHIVVFGPTETMFYHVVLEHRNDRVVDETVLIVEYDGRIDHWTITIEFQRASMSIRFVQFRVVVLRVVVRVVVRVDCCSSLQSLLLDAADSIE